MKKVRRSKCSDMVPVVIVDPEAETIRELMELTGRRGSWMADYANRQVSLGVWERVRKRVGVKLVPAYRPKK